MRTRSLVFMLLVGCSQTVNPCPKGNHPAPGGSSCVADEPVLDSDASAVTDDTVVDAVDADVPPENEDASVSDEMDASVEGDANADGEISSPDADDSSVDGDVSSPDADASSPDAAVCSENDVSLWRASHLTGKLVELTLGCATKCNTETQCTVRCVNDDAKLADCKECTSQQSLCVTEYCGAACTVSQDDNACLACQCEADCVGRFERCAGSKLDLCPADRFGALPTANDPPPLTPLIYRQKSGTGGLHTLRLASVDGVLTPFLWSYQFSRYFRHLVSFPLNGREYMLHAKSDCRGAPCTAKISAVLADGAFARPQYQSVWNQGFDELDVFGSQGSMYLSRYKSSKAPSDGEPAGTLWIDRIVLSEGAITLTPVLRSTVLASEQQSFDQLEPFELDGVTYLLAHHNVSGKAEIFSFVNGAVAVVSDPLVWSVGWDVLETFKLGERWYLFAYNSGRTAGSAESAGAARLYGFVRAGQRVSLSAALYESVWAAGATNAVGIRAASESSIVLHNVATGRTEQHVLSIDEGQWTSFSTSAAAQTAGFKPPWDVFEVALQGKW